MSTAPGSNLIMFNKLDLFLDDKRLFQIFVHHAENKSDVGPWSTYEEYKEDAIAFGWDSGGRFRHRNRKGLIVRVLPVFMSPCPENINDYFIEEGIVIYLLRMPERNRSKPRKVAINNNENQTTLLICVHWSEQNDELESIDISTYSTSNLTKDQTQNSLRRWRLYGWCS